MVPLWTTRAASPEPVLGAFSRLDLLRMRSKRKRTDRYALSAGYDVDESFAVAADVPRSAPPPPASSPSGSTPGYARRSLSAGSATT
jgi:hypothetical protein